MRTERKPTIELGQLLLELTARVRPDRADGINAAVVLATPEERWTLRLNAGRLTVGLGGVERPDAVISSDAATLVDINTGRLTGSEAFLDGRVTVRGNLGLALRLESMFIPPIPRPVTAPQDRTVYANGLPVSIVEAGRGDPVLLLHGLGATKASFLPTLMALSKDHRVIAPDLLGHGDTAKPLVRYDAPTFARFVQSLMDALDIERADLIGNSMGGRISLEVAMTTPDRVRSVTLLCPAVAFLKRRGFVPFVRALRPELGALPHRLPHRIVVRSIRSMFSQPDRLPASWYQAGADEFLRIFRTPRGRAALYASMRNIYLDEPAGERGFWARLERLDRPSLFVWGARDRLVPAAFDRHVRRVLPHAESHVLEDCGHVPQFELPDRTHALIRSFMSNAA
ncbi:MAG: alpha/beta fold hydrolase [Actinobacteria bacterium]|nr:MAG: alpha/beta fold hydrolase [Actinomycetota bacterium]